jgi:hypothetical protein
MIKRYIPGLAVLACLSVAGTPALATDDPPQSPPAATSPAQPAPADTGPATGAPTVQGPAPCADLIRPRSRVLTSSRTAARLHVLRGTALDSGCSGSSVGLVTVSVALKHGQRCRFLTRRGHLSRTSSCKRPSWLSATGTKRWSLRLPRRLPHGSYQVLTRAVDSAGNVERAHARRLAVRRPR